jgi:hypothetical protein
MKTASLPLLLLTFAVAAHPARADVRVEVDPGAPFTEADLADAVQIRTPDGGGEVVVRVAKLGMDQLVVIVGDKSQVVTLPDRDRAGSSRVVALVVTGMLGGDELMVPEMAPSPEAAPPPRPRVPPHRTSLGVGTLLSRDDGGYWITYVNGVVARDISPNARLVGTLGVGRLDEYLDSRTLIFPFRVGFEAHAGAAAIEIGGEVINYRESSCGAAEWGHSTGPYGAAKVFLPVAAGARIVGELGGNFLGSVSPTACRSEMNYSEYGGWIGAGVEWAQ